MFTILWTLLSGLFGKSATTSYPFAPKKYLPAARGHIENEIEACIFCGICQRKCPTAAIEVNRAEKSWAIERFKCIQCNCCVEFCPKKCLSMRGEPTPVSGALTRDVVKDARIPADPANHTNG